MPDDAYRLVQLGHMLDKDAQGDQGAIKSGMIQRVDRRAVVPDLERHVHRAKRDSLEREAAL
mgnify:CR=1 FL=1